MLDLVRGRRAPSPTARFVRIVATNALLLIVGLVILEAAFGNWLSPNWLYSLNVLRNVDRVHNVSHLYAAAAPIHYKRDQFGLRGYYSDIGDIDILTIGGSTTDQRYLDEGKTWQDVLRHQFFRSGCDISVVNAGVDGQSSYGHIKDFEWWFPQIPNLHARYILFYVGLNDFYKTAGTVYDDLAPSFGLRAEIKDRSALYHLYRTLVGIYLTGSVYKTGHRIIDFTKIKWTTTPRLRDYGVLMQNRLTMYRERIVRLAQLTKQRGAMPVFVTQQSRRYKVIDGIVHGWVEELPYEGVSVNGVDYYYMLEKLNQSTLEAAQRSGALSIDLARDLSLEDTDFYDQEHNTPAGATTIGMYLYRRLADIIACPARKRSQSTTIGH